MHSSHCVPKTLTHDSQCMSGIPFSWTSKQASNSGLRESCSIRQSVTARLFVNTDRTQGKSDEPSVNPVVKPADSCTTSGSDYFCSEMHTHQAIFHTLMFPCTHNDRQMVYVCLRPCTCIWECVSIGKVSLFQSRKERESLLLSDQLNAALKMGCSQMSKVYVVEQNVSQYFCDHMQW